MNEMIENYRNLSPEKQKLVSILLSKQGIEIETKFILPQKRDKNLFPMSFAQKRLWFLEKFEPESSLYIIPSGVKISGKISFENFIYAINEVVKRHEILRTRFIEKDGEGYQEIIDELKVEAVKYDLTKYSNIDNSQINKIFTDEFQKPFKLSEIPLFRIAVIKVTEVMNYLLIPTHHIISDNWSTGIFVKEIIEFYNHKTFGKELTLDEIKIQYADYTVWQNKWLNSEEFKKQKDYWTAKLKGSSEVLEIIPDKKRPSIQTYNGKFEIFSLDCVLTNDLNLFCKKHDITNFILLLSAFHFTLSKYSNQNDINIGIPIASRNRSEIENLIGFFINTLVMRGTLDYNKTVIDFINEIKNNSFEAYSNQDVPFEMIVDELKLERDMSHTALFQAMLVLNNASSTKLEIENIIIEPIEFDPGKTKFDLVLSLTPNDDIFNCKFEFNTDLFNDDTISGIINSFKFILNEFVKNHDKKLKDINLIVPEEIEKKSLKLNNNIENSEAVKLLHSRFEEITELNFNKRAVKSEKSSITFGGLNNYANNVANKLSDAGLNLGDTVGIFIDRRIEYLSSILGIFKSGGVFVPLDISYPEERLKYIIENSKIKYVITLNEFIGKINYQNIILINLDEIVLIPDIENPQREIFDNNLAYIIYTSGTSGLPKGVAVEHCRIANHIEQMISQFSVTGLDKYLQFASFNFDASLEQLFVPLLAGAEVFLRGNEYWLPTDFINLIKSEGITIINPPTVYWNQLVGEIKNKSKIDFGNLKLVIVGGEEMQVESLTAWKQIAPQNIKLINAYGPTETIITSAMFKTEDMSVKNTALHVPIGKCIGVRELYILDQFGNFVNEGIPGELCFSGELLAQSYFDNPIVTAEKFIPNRYSKHNGARIYRTGDLARYDKNGYIEYLGRIDNQVKLRGFRIELNEIVQVLLKHENVKNAAVKIVNDSNGNGRITAFVILDKQDNQIQTELLNYCRLKLPNYMIPNQIICLESFPINASGKLDLNRLIIPSENETILHEEFTEPRTNLEKEICLIVSEILDVDKVGLYNSFFDLGGHSILAIKLLSKIKEVFGVELKLKSLFGNPTVFGLSEAVLMEQAKQLNESDLDDLLNEIEKIEK